ncbi:hypothetical protein H310_04484 [Aphanomyces invadans]|uniref:Uncharacterized protein n=1 Tax=Aphanomyces invadans TaxID=157072 RepID=A0A024UCY1_9STRA|nr:hypothetical protein H310_04484 [Aphanomyces invadans]ETW04124.1 hypothetical protein H310_04484 [Aphanomyces invadans]|eukprot:XP_008867080.1 hypothetical protein H310_04484 [Aphanomyces invadans]
MLLPSPTSPSVLCPAQHPKSKRPPRRQFPFHTDDTAEQEEVQSLAKELNDLQARLNDLTNRATSSCKRKWTWCDVAMSQRKELDDGLHEQKRLKLAVDEHMEIIASLQEVVKSSQRVRSVTNSSSSTVHSHLGRQVPMEDWRCNRLPEDEAAWTAGILNMLTRDYERVDTMLVRNGLVDCHSNLCKTVVRRNLCGSVISIDKLTHLQLQCHTFDDVVKIMNALVLTDRGRECLVKGTKWDTLELLERMEANSMYMKCKAKCPAGAIQWLEGQVAVKRFVELNRVVFVVRSVLEDARHPMAHLRPCYAHDEVGWFVIERQVSRDSPTGVVCCVKSIVSCTPSSPQPACAFTTALYSAATSAADCVQKWFRSCVNVYRQQNRSVTELLVHALAQRFRPLCHAIMPPTAMKPTVDAALSLPSDRTDEAPSSIGGATS